MNDNNTYYANLEFIKEEVENSKKLFRKYDWPTIDVTRKSVEETAASIVKIYDIKKEKWKLFSRQKVELEKLLQMK